MCSLCGVLGGKAHWTEEARPAGDTAGAARPMRLRERQERVRLLNLVLGAYGLTVDDWAGTSYVLRTRTGRIALVNHLTELWIQAEKMQRRPCDPLDPELLRSLAPAPSSSSPPPDRES